MQAKQSIPRGAFWMAMAMLGVSISAAIVKWASAGFSSEWLMMVRWISGLIAFLVAFLFMRRIPLRTQKWPLQSGVAISWILAMYLFFVAVRYVPLMDATVLMNTASLFMPALNGLLNRQRDPPAVWVGTGIGFLGILVILQPGRELFQPMALFALLSGLMVALRQVLQARLTDEPHARTTFYSMTVGMLGCLVIFALAGFPVGRPDWQEMLFAPANHVGILWQDTAVIAAIVMLGLCSLTQPWLLNLSMHHASLGVLSPFRYTAAIFAAGFDWIFWHQRPSLTSWLGLALIAAGSTLVVLSGRKAARQAATHAPLT